MNTLWLGNDSSKTIPDTLQLTKIKNRETTTQGITVVKSTTSTNQSIRSDKSSMTCEIASEMYMIPHLSNKTLTDVLDMPQEGKISVKPYTKVPDHRCRREEITKNINSERFVELLTLHIRTKNVEFSFI